MFTLPNIYFGYKTLQITLIASLTIISCCACEEQGFCVSQKECNSEQSEERYLFYDVNAYEGFNLRRDVYMRMAFLAHHLSKAKNPKLRNFRLVLPPWSHLVHWRYSEIPEQIPWGHFFDLESLKSFAPVIEMHEFFHAIDSVNRVVIEEGYTLQHFEDMFETGNFEDRMRIEDCIKKEENFHYFFYQNISCSNWKCLSFHGAATKLNQILLTSQAKTIIINHAEVALHEMFGNKLYWEARRSMRFNKELKQIADTFRHDYLNSSDESDNTHLPEDWRKEKPKRNAIGGPYLSVHLRRKDFLVGRSHQVPTLENVAKKIIQVCKEIHVNRVFIATDATKEEYTDLNNYLGPSLEIYRFKPNSEDTKYTDGAIAIIDQIISSYAKHFIGTYESTFSFRIQEEREILGFPTHTTFNSFCKDDKDCPQPSEWKIVY